MGHTDARLSRDGRNPSHKEALYKSATKVVCLRAGTGSTGASSKANNFQIMFGIVSGPEVYASLGVTRR